MYVKTRLGGLSRARFETDEMITRSTGYVPPSPIIGQTIQPIIGPTISFEQTEDMIRRRGCYSHSQWAALGPIGRKIIIGWANKKNFGSPMEIAGRERRLHLAIIAAGGEGVIPSTVRPVQEANAKLAFEYAEAKKWGYSHSAWMALGASRRIRIRQQYPSGGGGPLSTISDISVPAVQTVPTTTGITFDDVIHLDPVKVQTAEEAAGIEKSGLETNDYIKYAVLAVSAWIMWDAFGKKSKPRRRRKMPPMRRQYPYASHAKRIRQGRQ